MSGRHLRLSYNNAYFDSLDQQDESSIHTKVLHYFRVMKQALPSGSVLDAGCGAGHSLTLFEKTARRVVGLDSSVEAACMAGRRTRRAVVCVGNLDTKLPFGDNSFDFVLSHEVIEHLSKPEVFLAEAFRVLRAGGGLLLKTPNAWDLWRLICYITSKTWYADVDRTHVRYYTLRSLKRLLKEAGFVRIKVIAGTKSFYRGQLGRLVPVRIGRLPVIGNGLLALGVKANNTLNQLQLVE